jgi:hypothetical protein
MVRTASSEKNSKKNTDNVKEPSYAFFNAALVPQLGDKSCDYYRKL